MAKERNALKAGTFIAVSIVLAIGVVIAISGTDALFQPKQVRMVIFALHDDIGGLQPGDPVRIGDLTSGRFARLMWCRRRRQVKAAGGRIRRSRFRCPKNM